MQLPALYQLTGEFREAASRLAELDLDPQTVKDTLDGIQGAIEVKAQHVAIVIRNLDALGEATKDAADKLRDRAKQIEHRADSLRTYLHDQLKSVGVTSIEPTTDLPYFKVSIAKNPVKLKVEDENAIPMRFWKRPEMPPLTLDRKAVLDALKAGEAVPGATTEQDTRLVIK